MVVNFRNNIKTNTEPSEKGDSQGLKKEVSKPIFEKKKILKYHSYAKIKSY